MSEARDFTRRRDGARLNLGAGAVQEYREAGWQITPYGRVDAGTTAGPCARCRATTEVYGEHGNPLCATCRPTNGATE